MKRPRLDGLVKTITGFQDRLIHEAARIAANRVRIEKESETAGHDYRQDYDYRVGSKLETEEDYIKAYRRHVWIYACVDVIAQSIAGLPLKVYEGTGDDRKEVTEGEAIDLLENPSPGQTGYDMREAIGTFLELTGDSYWEIARGTKTGLPRELHWLFSDRMKILPIKDGGVSHYEYSVSGSPIRLEPNQVLHFKYLNPRSKLYGHAPIKAIVDTLTVDFYARAYNKNFFKQGGRLSMYLSTKEKLGEKQFKRAKKQLREEYGGVEKHHRMGVFEQGAELKDFGATPKDAEFIELLKLDREEVLAAFGVPPVIVGILEKAPYANAYEQAHGFWQNTLKPKLQKIQTTLDIIVQEFNPNYYCEFDLSEVEALRENEKELAGRRVLYVKNRIKTVNEVRAEMGLEPVEWGDEPPPAGGGGGSPFGLAMSADVRKKKDNLNWKEWAEEARRYENKLFSLLKLEFERMHKGVMERLKEKVKKVTPPPVDAILFDLDAEDQLLISAVTVLLQDAAQFFGDKGLARMQLGMSFDLYDPKALEMLRRNIEAYFGKKGVAMTLRNALAEQLKEGYKLGESMKQMAERVNQVFKPYTQGSAAKARMIARSETMRAANGATLEAWKQSGVVTGKRWFPAADACEWCLELGRMSEVALDKDFHSEQFGDMQIPPAHPNCRCSMEAIT